MRQATVKFGGGRTELLKIETLGEATPMARDTAIMLWKDKGTPLDQVKGLVQAYPKHNTGQTLTNIKLVAATYPVIEKSDADYMFEIDAQSTPLIDTSYFLVEPGNTKALEECIETSMEKWGKSKRPELMSLVRAEVFTNLIPWLAIVLFEFSEKSKGSNPPSLNQLR